MNKNQSYFFPGGDVLNIK